MVAQGGLTITIDDAQVRQLLGQIVRRGADLRPALSAVGALIRESIRTNFTRGGRPGPWAALKNRKGQPLRDTGRLMNSITRRVTDHEVRVGTNAVYAAVHHFGARKGSFGVFTHQVKPHQRQVTQAFGRKLNSPVLAMVSAHGRKVALPRGDIPARPFMLVQDEDLVEIRSVLTNWILRGQTQ